MLDLTRADPSRVTFHPLPQDDPRRRRPDIGRAEAQLGWSPRIGIDDGLAATCAWFAAEIGVELQEPALAAE